MVESTVMRFDASLSGRMEMDTDIALVRRARDGDYGAFELLFERCGTGSFRQGCNGNRENASH